LYPAIRTDGRVPQTSKSNPRAIDHDGARDVARLLRGCPNAFTIAHADVAPCRSEPDLTDGDATDEVRWTTTLHVGAGRLNDVHIDRQVDSRVIG
jgi:hypothetical protein